MLIKYLPRKTLTQIGIIWYNVNSYDSFSSHWAFKNSVCCLPSRPRPLCLSWRPDDFLSTNYPLYVSMFVLKLKELRRLRWLMLLFCLTHVEHNQESSWNAEGCDQQAPFLRVFRGGLGGGGGSSTFQESCMQSRHVWQASRVLLWKTFSIRGFYFSLCWESQIGRGINDIEWLDDDSRRSD